MVCLHKRAVPSPDTARLACHTRYCNLQFAPAEAAHSRLSPCSQLEQLINQLFSSLSRLPAEASPTCHKTSHRQPSSCPLSSLRDDMQVTSLSYLVSLPFLHKDRLASAAKGWPSSTVPRATQGRSALCTHLLAKVPSAVSSHCQPPNITKGKEARLGPPCKRKSSQGYKKKKEGSLKGLVLFRLAFSHVKKEEERDSVVLVFLWPKAVERKG